MEHQNSKSAMQNISKTKGGFSPNVQHAADLMQTVLWLTQAGMGFAIAGSRVQILVRNRFKFIPFKETAPGRRRIRALVIGEGELGGLMAARLRAAGS